MFATYVHSTFGSFATQLLTFKMATGAAMQGFATTTDSAASASASQVPHEELVGDENDRYFDLSFLRLRSPFLKPGVILNETP